MNCNEDISIEENAMSENNKPKENQKRQFDAEQYQILFFCSGKEDITEWNEWRAYNMSADGDNLTIVKNRIYLT